jgi:hypothetical protein
MLVFFVGNTFLAESEEDWGGFPLTLEVVTSSRSVRVSADVALAAYVREQMLMCLSTMTGDITSTTGKPYPVVRADFMSGDDYDTDRTRIDISDGNNLNNIEQVTAKNLCGKLQLGGLSKTS